MQKLKLKKGDAVKVIAGKEAGKTGKILKVISKENKIVVEKLKFLDDGKKVRLCKKCGESLDA